MQINHFHNSLSQSSSKIPDSNLLFTFLLQMKYNIFNEKKAIQVLSESEADLK